MSGMIINSKDENTLGCWLVDIADNKIMGTIVEEQVGFLIFVDKIGLKAPKDFYKKRYNSEFDNMIENKSNYLFVNTFLYAYYRYFHCLYGKDDLNTPHSTWGINKE